MADNEPKGPVMLCVTKVLKPPPTRVGKIGNNFTLARTVPLASLVGGAIGGFVGMSVFGLLLGFTINAVVWGAGAGIGIVLFVLNYQPIAGESFAKWLGLNFAAATRGTVMYKGRRVRMSIGMTRISRVARGRVRIRPSSVPVNPDQFDDRGVLISPKNMNVPVSDVPDVEPSDLSIGTVPVQHLPERAPVDKKRRRRRGRDTVTPDSAGVVERPDRSAGRVVRPDDT